MPRLLPNSLHRQLVLFLLLGLSLLLIFCFPLWNAWNTEIEDGRADLLRADALRMQEIFVQQGAPSLAQHIRDRVGSELNATRQVMMLAAPDGHRLAGNLSLTPPHVPADGYANLNIPMPNGQITIKLLAVELPGGYMLWLGRDISRFERLEQIFVRGMMGSAVIALLAAAIATIVAQRSARNRITRINRAANDIMEGNLARRLPVSPSNDEFEQLADTVNCMLDQIEHLVENVKQSSNAIAHDLRTPLAELRAHLEHLAVTKPPYDEVQNGLDIAIADVDRVIGIFNAILRLAEIDSGTRRAGFHVFDVATIVEQATEFYEPLAEDCNVILVKRIDPSLLVRGDPVLLAQALANLIDNALKYAAVLSRDARVTLECHRAQDGGINIAVADNGPGIATSDRARAALPFFRADGSRGSPGVGLGLTLVAAVARLHGGSLELLDNEPGLRAQLRFQRS